MKKAALLLCAILCFSGILSAGEISEQKIHRIRTIVRQHYFRVINPGWKNNKGRIYKSVDDSRLKNDIKKAVTKAIAPAPFICKARIVPYDAKARKEIEKIMRERYAPNKTPEKIAEDATTESVRNYPLVQKGEEVIVRCFKNGRYQQLEGKIQSIRGRNVEIQNQLVPFASIKEEDRCYFDPILNEECRKKFRDYYRSNYPDICKRMRIYLQNEASSKVVQNEKNGYIFYSGAWRSAAFVTDAICKDMTRFTKKRFKMETDRQKKIDAGKKKPAAKK